jgi:hypothetical protein
MTQTSAGFSMAAIALAARRSFSQVLLKLMMYTPVWEQIICGCYTQNNTLINQKVIFLHLFYKIVHMVINTRLVSVTCIRNVLRYAMHFYWEWRILLLSASSDVHIHQKMEMSKVYRWLMPSNNYTSYRSLVQTS